MLQTLEAGEMALRRPIRHAAPGTLLVARMAKPWAGWPIRRITDGLSPAPNRAWRLLGFCCAALVLCIGIAVSKAHAADPAASAEANIAQQLQNPIANLISVPVQNNFDYGGGPAGHGSQYTVNIQPLIPVRLEADWNLITRAIIPITQLSHIQPEGVGGLGDIVQSFFLSPTRPIAGMLIGAGPVLLYPTGLDNRISANQWAAGPTAAVVKQAGPWTVGILANHLQGCGGIGHNGQGGQTILAFEDFTTPAQGARSTRVSTTCLQPFASCTFATRTTISTATEAAYDWTGRTWVVPVVAGISQVLKLGEQPFSLELAGKCTAVQPDGAAAWGMRLTFTLLLPT